MSEQLHAICYISKSRLDGDVPQAMSEIVRQASKLNSAVGLTGALICSQQYFAQVLEGPLSALEETFERILVDRRHGDISVLYFSEIDARSFDSWGMASAGFTHDETGLAETLDMISQDIPIDGTKDTGQEAMEFLNSLLSARELS